jgi:DNA-binding response OmpR family regulator
MLGMLLCLDRQQRMTGMDLDQSLITRDPELARRVVFVTAGAFTPGAADFLAAVPNRHLDKPFTPPELLAFVQHLLSRSAEERSIRSPAGSEGEDQDERAWRDVHERDAPGSQCVRVKRKPLPLDRGRRREVAPCRDDRQGRQRRGPSHRAGGRH